MEDQKEFDFDLSVEQRYPGAFGIIDVSGLAPKFRVGAEIELRRYLEENVYSVRIEEFNLYDEGLDIGHYAKTMEEDPSVYSAVIYSVHGIWSPYEEALLLQIKKTYIKDKDIPTVDEAEYMAKNIVNTQREKESKAKSILKDLKRIFEEE